MVLRYWLTRLHSTNCYGSSKMWMQNNVASLWHFVYYFISKTMIMFACYSLSVWIVLMQFCLPLLLKFRYKRESIMWHDCHIYVPKYWDQDMYKNTHTCTPHSTTNMQARTTNMYMCVSGKKIPVHHFYSVHSVLTSYSPLLPSTNFYWQQFIISISRRLNLCCSTRVTVHFSFIQLCCKIWYL